MSRQAILQILAITAVAVLGFFGWMATARRSAPPAEPLPSPAVLESNRAMAQWRQYAKGQPNATNKLLLPYEVVDLMDSHSARAFPERRVTFLLWQPTMAPPPGYTVNPGAGAGRGTGSDAFQVWGWNHKTLHDQTDSLLNAYGFRVLVIDGQGYVVRKDAFLPHLITHHLFYSEDVSKKWHGWARMGGGWDVAPVLSGREGINMGPGTSAQLSPDGQVLTLRVDELDLERAEEVSLAIAGESSGWKRLKKKLRDGRDQVRKSIFGWIP